MHNTQARSWFCVTRAIKNAKYLQKAYPHIMPEIEPSEGFGSVIPLDILDGLHRDQALNEMSEYAHLSELLKESSFPAIRTQVTAPLFNGTLFFVHMEFTIQDQNNDVISISNSDISTILNYANLATVPISEYAAQYGQNSVAVNQFIIPFAVTLPSATYNDVQLQGWVNSIISQYKLSSSTCIVVLNPPGVVNTDCDPSRGHGGYHSLADVPYIFSNVRTQNLTLEDSSWSYAGHLSHEIAEMVVDPRDDLSNPEVCDPCGPNCISTFLDYFDSNGNYIATSQAFPPSFPYHFFINGIIKPDMGSCPKGPADPNRACNYEPSINFFTTTSDVSPASAGRASNLFVFVKTLDGRIIFNQIPTGADFVGWQEVPGGAITDVALAAGMRADTLFVFAKTPDGRIIFNQAAKGGAFVGWQEMPGGKTTDVALASAGRASNLFIFAKALDGHIIFNQAAPGGPFVGWQEVPDGAITDVALAAGMRADILFVFAKTPDGHIIFNQAAKGGAFDNWRYQR